MQCATEIIKQFALYLDKEDFNSAEKLLSDKCLYQSRQGTIIGADKIIESYRESAIKARELLDEVKYESILKNDHTVLFTDIITKNGKTHKYQSKQSFNLNDDNLITQITHEEIPGEREKLNKFFADCGIKW